MGVFSVMSLLPHGRKASRFFALCALVAPLLAACGSGGGFVGDSGVKRGAFSSKEFGVAVSPRVTTAKYPARGGGRYLPLNAYTVRGTTYQPIEGPGYVERGSASWYGQDFHGRRTANGEVFGAFYLTAASPVLPIPSYARVTNLENGRSLLVRVNDRGPYLKGRVIDLSYQAASILGYVDKGSAQVEVRYVGPAPLEGDDTKMLMASVDRPTRLEQQLGGYDRERSIQLAAAEIDRSSGSGTLLGGLLGAFAYAESGTPVAAAEAAAGALAAGTVEAAVAPNTPDAEADRAIRLRLGVFPDAGLAAEVATAFAPLGAVDEDIGQLGDRTVAVLTLTKLKPGVARADVLDLAQRLGLNDIILY